MCHQHNLQHSELTLCARQTATLHLTQRTLINPLTALISYPLSYMEHLLLPSSLPLLLACFIGAIIAPQMPSLDNVDMNCRSCLAALVEQMPLHNLRRCLLPCELYLLS
jgi:hypothetical protein